MKDGLVDCEFVALVTKGGGFLEKIYIVIGFDNKARAAF